MSEHGDTVAGRKIELIVQDDAGTADTTKRIAQEMIVNDKVGVLAGFGLTPLALAVAPLAARGKTPAVVMAAATSSVTEASHFMVRTSYTTPQVTSKIAEWAASDGIKSVALCPGFVETPMTEFVREQVPAEDMIRVEDVAEAVRFVLRTSPNCVIPEIVFQRPGEAL